MMRVDSKHIWSQPRQEACAIRRTIGKLGVRAPENTTCRGQTVNVGRRCGLWMTVGPEFWPQVINDDQ